MTAPHLACRAWRSVCLTLAMLALVIKVAVPAGYMIDRNQQGVALVLCTSQGPVAVGTLAVHHGGPDAPAKAGHEAPCAFAGHGSAFVAPEPSPIGLIEPFVYSPGASSRPATVTPGRGLAAPPLPARGPPAVA